MKILFNKTTAVRSGLLASALILGALGFTATHTTQANNQAVVKLRGVSKVGLNSAFAMLDAKANTEPVQDDAVNPCGSNASECTIYYNGRPAEVIGFKD
jgi:hypothetical protein